MRTQAADLAAGKKAQSTDDLDAIEEAVSYTHLDVYKRQDVDLEGLVVLADDHTVANAAQVGPQTVQGLIRRFADDEHGVKGKGDVLVTRCV